MFVNVRVLMPGQSGSRSRSKRCRFVRNSETLEGEGATAAWCFGGAAVSFVEVRFLVDFGAATRADLVRDSRLF